MKTVNVTDFKSHCLQLLEEARLTGESITVLKYGRPLATVTPAESIKSYTPGQFKDTVQIVGDILVDNSDLGIEWEALN